jgi:hypothetical protein
MLEHLPGIITIVLSILLVIGLCVWRASAFKKRWDVDRYGGVLVRFDRGASHTNALGAELEEGFPKIRKVAQKRLPDHPELLEFMVEVVPPGQVRTPTVPTGKFSDGSEVGGSIRTERALPFTKKHWVLVVVNERTIGFCAHEYCSHVLPKRVVGNVYTHDREGHYYPWAQKWLEFEREAKEELERIA